MRAAKPTNPGIEAARLNNIGVALMNQQFTALSKSGCFATAIVTTFFAPTHELTLCNAGHPPPLLYRAKTNQWSLLERRSTLTDAENVPLGILDLGQYDQFSVRLKVGDLVLCYTDSLIESNDENGHMLGPKGVLKIAHVVGRFRNPPRHILLPTVFNLS